MSSAPGVIVANAGLLEINDTQLKNTRVKVNFKEEELQVVRLEAWLQAAWEVV